MQLQLSYFFFFFFVGVFLFTRYCWNGCFSSIHNVKDPVVRNGFSCASRKEFGLDWITGTDSDVAEVTGSVFSPPPPRLPVWVWFGTSRGHHLITSGFLSLLDYCSYRPEASLLEAKRRLDLHLSHCLQTITKTNSKYPQTWVINLISTSTLSVFHCLFSKMKVGLTYHRTSKGKTNKTNKKKKNTPHHRWSTHLAGHLHFSSVLFFMLSLLKAFIRKRKKNLVDFWAVISNQ